MDKRRLDDGTVLVGFELPEAVSARTVSVVGDFNGWIVQTHPLNRVDGGFRTEIRLPAGDRWRFRYVLDGERWENDWAADDYVPNDFGQDDSVVDLTDPKGLPLALISGTSPTDDAAAALAPALGLRSGAEVPAADADPTDAPRRPGLLRRWWHRVTRRDRATGATGEAPAADAGRVTDDAALVGAGR